MTKATHSPSLVSCFKHPTTIIISIGLLSIIMILTLSTLILRPSFSSEIISYGNNGTTTSNCNCVVFRLDDIQDYWITSGQLAAMNQFTSRNQSLTLGIIMSIIGNDSSIVNKVKEGTNNGLFELAVHGWNHTEYAKLSEEEQRKTMYDANRKMSALFGNSSEIFIPPLDSFNNDTINAMEQVGMKILNGNESSIDELELKGNNDSQALSSLPTQSRNISYIIPSTIAFKDYYGGQYIQNSVQDIFNNVTQSISTYGYAVVVVHPQDFMKIDANGTTTDELDENPLRDLSSLIDSLLSKNIHLGSFSEIIGETESIGNIATSSNSTSQDIVVDRVEEASFFNCSGGWTVTGYFSPSESDYEGRGDAQTITIYGLYDTNSTVSRALNSEFLKDVQIEGWGLTKQGDYIGGWDGKFWGPSSVEVTDLGEPLIAGVSAATDRSVIPYGTNFTVPSLPMPWNTKVFTASDIGTGITGKHIDIFTGIGSAAEREAIKITGMQQNNTVCISG
jgi:3D (Asp-Asp-Asp) domain-containing protein/peptidoglycan/xylan/chitin deacetylase (PgdA/CDA1 family)